MSWASTQRDAQSSYQYTVTFGPALQTKGKIYFSPKELKHLGVAVLLVTRAPLDFSYGQKKLNAMTNNNHFALISGRASACVFRPTSTRG